MKSKASRLVVAAGILFASACQGTQPKGPKGPELIRTVPYTNLDLVTGGGESDLIGVVYTNVENAGSFAGFRATLHLYRHDAAYPDDLVDLGDTYLGVDTLYHRVEDAAITSDWAAVTINYNEAPAGWVALVSLIGPNPGLRATIPLDQSLDRAVAAGQWLLVAAGTKLTLFDLAVPESPALVTTRSTAGSITCLAPTPSGFLAFTSSGYVRVEPDAAAPTFTETSDDVLRNFGKAYADGGELVLAGPSIFAGKSRVVRVGLALGTPVLVHSSDLEGAFVDFAFDGDTNAALQTTPGGASDSFSVLHERVGGFDATITPTPHWYWGPGHLAARQTRLYSAEPGGLSLYRLP
jgi:hypothetical protein